MHFSGKASKTRGGKQTANDWLSTAATTDRPRGQKKASLHEIHRQNYDEFQTGEQKQQVPATRIQHTQDPNHGLEERFLFWVALGLTSFIGQPTSAVDDEQKRFTHLTRVTLV